MNTTAKYIRLSSEDADLKQSGKLESNSIANQRNLLNAFISRTPDLAESHVVEFCDDGWSGKNFDRPAFQELMAQVRQGKIQCIVVKDLSRLGRDYLAVGNYLSYVFPFLGIRFIAVNDGFDSIRPADIDSLETSFKTILYDLYSRDLSRKVRNAKRFRAQRGDFLAPFAPYGYKKDPANKNHLIVDPEAAKIVRRIFLVTANGQKKDQTARQLNQENVPTPMLYKRAAGCSRTSWPSLFDENFWTGGTVQKILQDERYVGKNIYGMHIRDKVGCAHVVRVDRKEWITVDSTHEGIVTQEEFDRAQSAIRMPVCREKHHWPLRGKVRCGTCGYAMARVNKSPPYFKCQTPRMNTAYTCSGRMLEADLLKAVSEGLRAQALMAVELKRLWEERDREQKEDCDAIKRKLNVLEASHQQYGQKITSLYESFALGEMDKTAYLAAKATVTEQKDAAAVKIKELKAGLENMGADDKLQSTFVSIFEKYVDVEEITKDIITEVLKEIRVHVGGRLEIVWNFRDDLEKLMLDLQMD